MYALLAPMPGLPWYLLPIWPLIFWRIQRLKAWFKAAGGPDSQMLWGVAWNGRVVVLQLSDDLSGLFPFTGVGQTEARAGCRPTSVSPANAGALGHPVRNNLKRSRLSPGLRIQNSRHLTPTSPSEHPYPTPSAPSGAARVAPYSNLRADLP